MLLFRSCPLRIDLAFAAWLALSPIAAACAPAIATLPDPTRPPGLASTAASPTRIATAPDSRGAVNVATAAATAPQPTPLPQLQSLQVSRAGPVSAVLDGQLVRAGDRIGERSVVAIDAQGLLLRHGGSHATERLQLLGGAVKQAPGSITITRHASFTPAAQTAQAPPTTDRPLTLAGRTAP